MNLFSGRKLVIATKHKKEKIIGPLAASRLGVLPVVPTNLDTDQLGTFTGEIARQADPLTTATKKCEMALALTGCDLAIASEGSFGGHPFLSFIPVNEELVVLIDQKNSLQIVGKKLSTNTNFAGQLCTREPELIRFAEQAGFPGHGLILRDRKESTDLIFKGICDWSHLKDSFRGIVKVYGQAYVETDMRAMYNPTRMAVIAEATQALLDKAVVACVKCHAPGFGTTDVIKGLPCRQCGSATQSVKLLVQSCPQCGHTETKPNPHKVVEDPRYCDYCNP